MVDRLGLRLRLHRMYGGLGNPDPKFGRLEGQFLRRASFVGSKEAVEWRLTGVELRSLWLWILAVVMR